MGEWKALKKASGTGWKELERELGTGWKALEWESVDIDVGAVAEDGSTHMAGSTRTAICFTNPVNENGTLTKLDLYIHTANNGKARVGLLYLVSGNTYKCRSAQDITGLSAGLNADIAVSLVAVAGDYIGIYSRTDPLDAYMELDGSVGAGKTALGNALLVDQERSFSTSWDYELKAYASNY